MPALILVSGDVTVNKSTGCLVPAGPLPYTAQSTLSVAASWTVTLGGVQPEAPPWWSFCPNGRGQRGQVTQ